MPKVFEFGFGIIEFFGVIIHFLAEAGLFIDFLAIVFRPLLFDFFNTVCILLVPFGGGTALGFGSWHFDSKVYNIKRKRLNPFGRKIFNTVKGSAECPFVVTGI